MVSAGNDQLNSLGVYSGQTPEVLSSIQQGLGSCVISNWPQTIVGREPRAFEFSVERAGTKIRMDFGSELRLVIADPIRGIDLREAIQKLKEALLKIHEPDS